MGLTDTIARFLTEMLDESPGELLVQRQELAQRFGVVPSQINYVLSSRFRPEQGYVIESRRGGGGYIRICRIKEDSETRVMHVVNSIGDALDGTTALHHLQNMVADGLLTREQGQLVAAAVSDKTLGSLERSARERVRADLFKNMLVSTLY